MPNRVKQAIAELKQADAASRRKGWTARSQRIRAALKVLVKPAPIPPPPAPKPWPAIEAARSQSQHGPAFAEGSCQIAVRTCFGVPSVGDFDGDGAADAEDAWKASKGKHPETDPTKIPRGYPIFWGGGSHDNGHVAVSAGAGLCWSTDIKRTGFFDLVPITLIHEKWGLPLFGWVEEYDGFPLEHGAVVSK